MGSNSISKPKTAQPKPRSILIIERDLVVLSGHQHTQIERISNLAPSQNIFVITTEDFALGDTLGTANIFPILPGRQARTSHQDMVQTAGIIANQISKLNMDARDKIVVPSCRTALLRTLLNLYQEAPDHFPPCKIRILSPDVFERLSRDELGALKKLMRRGLMSILTETAELALHIRQQHDVDCTDQFLLPASIPVEGLDTSPSPEKDLNHFQIGCLGQARRGKGSFDIPKIVTALRKTLRARDQNIRITLYVQKPVGKPLRNLLFWWQDQKSRHLYPNVKIHILPSALSPGDFRDLMGRLDLLLLPYWISRYGQRGSGMVTDGVLARKPLVYSKGLSMQKLLTHGNAEAASTPQEFAESLLKICTGLEDYKQGAVTAAAYFAECLSETEHMLDQ